LEIAMNDHIEAAVVRQHARGQWFGILGRLAPSLEPALVRPGRHVPCPVHGGQDGFRVFNDANEGGGGICNTCGPRRDGFALLMWANDWGFRVALEAVAPDLRLDGGGFWSAAKSTPRRAPVSAQHRDHAGAESALRRIWSETLDPYGREALPLRRYLLRRGIDAMPDPAVVRFHPALGYYEERVRVGTYPAIISRVTDAAGQPVTLHRTYLTTDGAKAPVTSPKKLMPEMGTLSGGAIRLFPAGAELGVTEGIETALAVRQRTNMPVWAGVSAALVEAFEPPPGVTLVVIWADLDRSGRGAFAANKLRARLLTMGIQVAVHLPPGPIPGGAKGLDWADVWSLKIRAAA
jgi:phage/plasmid primase-like uncharacterized protein